MASSVSVGYVPWLDGGTYNEAVLRTLTAASWYNTGAAQILGGVVPSGGAMQVTAGGGMSVAVATGYAVVPASAGSTAGGYVIPLMSPATLTVATSDPSNPRIDIVVANVVDNGDATSFGEVQILAGTPSPVPSPPTAPSNSITLAQVAVGAGVTSIVTGNITDVRTRQVAQGGIMPIQGISAAPTGFEGFYAHDRVTHRLLHNLSTGPAQPTLLPFVPANAKRTTSLPLPVGVSLTTVLSVSVATDGNTDIEIYISWPGFTSTAATLVSQILIDGTQVHGSNHAPSGGISTQGGSQTHFTSATVGDTPSAGTHTITWKISNLNLVNSATLDAASSAPALLRVSAVPL